MNQFPDERAVPPDDHLSPDRLLDYFDQRLGEADEVAVEEHLADCARCARAARAALADAPRWQSWTAAAHGAAHLRAVVQRSLAAARAQSPRAAWRGRLDRWADEWGGMAEAAVRAILGAGPARLVTNDLGGLLRPGATWHFAPPVAAPVRGDPYFQSRSRQYSDQRWYGRSTETSTTTEPRTRVVVAPGPELDLRVDLMAGVDAPLVALVPLDPVGPALVAEPEWRPELPYRSARFTGLSPGEYLVVFEPTPSTPPAEPVE
jgi:anti-sigma factor RsiW